MACICFELHQIFKQLLLGLSSFPRCGENIFETHWFLSGFGSKHPLDQMQTCGGLSACSLERQRFTFHLWLVMWPLLILHSLFYGTNWVIGFIDRQAWETGLCGKTKDYTTELKDPLPLCFLVVLFCWWRTLKKKKKRSSKLQFWSFLFLFRLLWIKSWRQNAA